MKYMCPSLEPAGVHLAATQIPSLLCCCLTCRDSTSRGGGSAAACAAGSSVEASLLSEEEYLLLTGRLHSVLRPFMMRRLKEAVARELPSKVSLRLQEQTRLAGIPCLKGNAQLARCMRGC